MTNFDPFGKEETAPPSDVFFGEFVIYRGFQGIRMAGVRDWVEFDSNDEEHKAIIADGKRVHVVYEYQHFPIGAKFETFKNQSPVWSDDWKSIFNSAGEILGVDPNDPHKRQEINEFLRGLTEGSRFFKYETPVIRKYKNSDGVEKPIRGIKLLEVFENADDCQAAYDEHKGELPQGSKIEEKKVEAISLEQAIPFLETLAKQSKDHAELAQRVSEMPMLANINLEDTAMQEIALKANPDLLPW